MWGNEIANIQAIGVECTSVIKAVEFLLHIPEGDQPIAIEGPAVGDGEVADNDCSWDIEAVNVDERLDPGAAGFNSRRFDGCV